MTRLWRIYVDWMRRIYARILGVPAAAVRMEWDEPNTYDEAERFYENERNEREFEEQFNDLIRAADERWPGWRDGTNVKIHRGRPDAD